LEKSMGFMFLAMPITEPAIGYSVAGADVARGPEQWAFYVQFGSAWMRP
jgi:hypothetical protein